MFYKYETHLHTSEVSLCATSSASEMVHAHKNAGYTGIIVTDHFLNGNAAVLPEECWHEQITRFLRGYNNAKAEGDKIGLDVFFGWEYTHNPFAEDFLTYNLSPQFLYNHPEIMDMSFFEYSRLVQYYGGVLIHAHPFREASYIKYPPNPKIKYIDGIEVVNGEANSPHNNNDKAWRLAKEYSELIRISGTDIHDIKHVGIGGVAFKYKIKSMAHFIKALRANHGYLIIDGKITDRDGNIIS